MSKRDHILEVKPVEIKRIVPGKREDYAEWRKVQRQWLMLPRIQATVASLGWDWSIWPGLTAVTYADVRDGLYPNWLLWMQRQIDEEKYHA